MIGGHLHLMALVSYLFLRLSLALPLPQVADETTEPK